MKMSKLFDSIKKIALNKKSLIIAAGAIASAVALLIIIIAITSANSVDDRDDTKIYETENTKISNDLNDLNDSEYKDSDNSVHDNDNNDNDKYDLDETTVCGDVENSNENNDKNNGNNKDENNDLENSSNTDNIENSKNDSLMDETNDNQSNTSNSNQTTATYGETTTKNNETSSSSNVNEKKPIGYCTILIECLNIYNNMSDFDTSLSAYLPQDGYFLHNTTVEVYEKDTVFDILERVSANNNIKLRHTFTQEYASVYIEAINNIGEFDCGTFSGWMYCVNGVYPNVGCSLVEVQNGDVIKWRYTCDLGNDVGAPMN